MSQIQIKKNPSQTELDELGVTNWPIWEKEVSNFPWHYEDEEVCYLLEGHVIVTPDQGEAVEIHAGELVTFQQGLSCHWDIKKAVKKHYQFN